MKSLIYFLLLFFLSFPVRAQSTFSLQQYRQFLQQNQNLEYDQLLAAHSPKAPYFSATTVDTNLSRFAYLDSVQQKFGLSSGEKALLRRHHFVVTERLSYESFGQAFHAVYANDLPVFVSTDAILQAVHRSYDAILIELEIAFLRPKLQVLADSLFAVFPQLAARYQGKATLDTALADVDLYVTILQSLVQGSPATPHLALPAKVKEVWTAIQKEQYTALRLFSDRLQNFDFSQFKVRGHYASRFFYLGNFISLKNYFKAMMWMGRIGFLLTPPVSNPWEPDWTPSEIRRMNLDAFLLNELLKQSGQQKNLTTMDHLLRFLVGESDNLTPDEWDHLLSAVGVTEATDLLNAAVYDSLQKTLRIAGFAQQKILGNILMANPYAAQPDSLPVSFRLLGQRFVVDSYILGNLVYDRIVYHGEKIWRPMPDPLDVLFVLGNDDALPLLKNDLQTYHYAAQAAALRYLIESWDATFWQQSLYSTWLECLRQLNPASFSDSDNGPFFMKTTAWHQEKLNTQLASWAELRHDNLLYAKQSYTSYTGCSFPRSFVEPYPAFYRQIALFAQKGHTFFAGFENEAFEEASRFVAYFQRLGEIADTLAILSQKELQGKIFTKAETIFLKKMLFESMVSGAPPYSGWYADLFFNPEDAALKNFVIADVHTQPSDANGSPVGRVLHVGVGKVNLGIFLTPAANPNRNPTAFVGPVFSFYQTITRRFKRFTDQEWADSVEQGILPARPDWAHVFLTDADGKAFPPGRELPGVLYTAVSEPQPQRPARFKLWANYPNPFNPATTFVFEIPRKSRVSIAVFNIRGEEIAQVFEKELPAGRHTVRWNASGLASGVYFYHVQAGKFRATKKLLLLK